MWAGDPTRSDELERPSCGSGSALRVSGEQSTDVEPEDTAIGQPQLVRPDRDIGFITGFSDY